MASNVPSNKGLTFQWFGKQIEKKFNKRLERNMKRLALMIEKEIKSSMTHLNPTGKTPSASGRPPAIVTGTLKKSIVAVVTKGRKGVISIFAGVAKGRAEEYALHLEFGTHKMAARPFIRPAVQKLKSKIIKELKI